MTSRRPAHAGRGNSRRCADIVAPGDSTRTTPRTRARRGEGPRLRAEILEAAERILIGTGDESAVSIRAVADAVGVTPPSIYLHFGDRNELIFAVCEEQFRHLDDAMQRAVQDQSDPLARLEARGRAYIDFGLNNPEHYRILMMGRPDCTPDRFIDGRLVLTMAFEDVIEDVQAAMATGAMPPGDPLMISSGLWMMVHGITSLFIAKPDFPWPDRDELLRHVLTTYQTGLTAPPDLS